MWLNSIKINNMLSGNIRTLSMHWGAGVFHLCFTFCFTTTELNCVCLNLKKNHAPGFEEAPLR